MEQKGGANYSFNNEVSIGGLPEVVSVDNCPKNTNSPVDFNNTLEVQVANDSLPKVENVNTTKGVQSAGGNIYSNIYDPVTGQKYLTNSKMGKNLLKNYIKMFQLINN